MDQQSLLVKRLPVGYCRFLHRRQIMKNVLLLVMFLALGSPRAALSEPDLSFSPSCDEASDKDQAIVAFTGDILIHKPLYLSVVGGSRTFSSIWEKTTPLLLKADFGVGNVEGPTALGIDKSGRDHGDVGFIYDDVIYSGTNLVFNFHPKLLSDLQDSGIDLITGANNHSMDRKSIGVDRTISAARTIGMKITGVRNSEDIPGTGDFFSVATIKNIRTAFIGCAEVLNGPDPLGQVLNCEGKEIFQIIKKLAADPDIHAIVVLPHWGVEYSHEVKSYQRDYARRYIEAGALAVVGSHPHVLQPWEKYTARDKREGIIFYSLGNFVACQTGEDRQTGAIFYLGLSKKQDEKARVFGGAYTPVYREDLSIVPLASLPKKEIQSKIDIFYGIKRRVGLRDLVKEKMCAK